MIGFYNYTVILTYISLLISTTGMGFAMAGKPYIALVCLLASGVCDMFDGMIARTRKTSTPDERRFGIQLDSLCDIVCFGALPAVIGLSIAKSDTPLFFVTCAAGGLLTLAALIRLAYFNVTEETRQSTGAGQRTAYEGLPVTASALIFPAVFLPSGLSFVPVAVGQWLYPAFLFLTAIAFITPVRVPKPRVAGLCVLGLLGLLELAALLFFLLF